ncbi:MAG: hypothetical protein ACKO96_06075, partial [Flammeovirgaceae bacterium]
VKSEKVILIRQVADKVVEVKSPGLDGLIVNFSIGSIHENSPADIQKAFVDSILKNCISDVKEAAKTVLGKLFLEVSQRGHGNLSVTIEHKKNKLPKLLKTDGVILNPPLDIVSAIRQLQSDGSILSLNELINKLALIQGMLNSDGVTVFGNNGTVLAYRVFIKHPSDKKGEKVEGGARSRTFKVLSDHVGKEIESCFMQSQDGKMKIKVK